MTNSLKNILSATANPHRNKTYVVSLVQEITRDDQHFVFGLRYVPDKLLLDHGGVADYLEQVFGREKENMEMLVHDILEGVMDGIIPKWIEISLMCRQNRHGQNILITLEDRQPGWEDHALLKRLPVIFS